jgi:excisionase family DNA binding protein
MSCENGDCQCDVAKKLEKLMSQAEVAFVLGVSQKTLEHWRWKGVGPRFVKVGSLVRYREADVLEYIGQ